jgi:hypothetical protein
MKSNGYIKIWRKLYETSFYKDSYALHLAVHLLLKCNHKDTTFVFNGKEMSLKRGSCVVGRYSLALETGIKESTVRNKMALLASTHFLDIKSTNKFSVVTIRKYETYQGCVDDKRTANGTTTGQQKDTYNNDKKEKNNYINKKGLEELVDFFASKKAISFKEKNHPYWIFFKRNCRAARELLEVCGDNMDAAKEAINGLSKVLEDKGMNWSLETIVRWYPDYSIKGAKLWDKKVQVLSRTDRQ